MGKYKKFLSTLKNEVVIEGYLHPVSPTSDSFSLPESGTDATCREARFSRPAGSHLMVYKFDKTGVKDAEGKIIKEPIACFKEGKAHSKCDYVLFYPTHIKGEEKLFVILCNLKSGNAGNNVDQLRSGEIFSTFLVETTKRLYNYDQTTREEDKIHAKDTHTIKILFHNRPPNKGVTKPGNNTRLNRENNFYQYSCQNERCDLEVLCKSHPGR